MTSDSVADATQKRPVSRRGHWIRRGILITLASLLAIVIAVAVIGAITPNPSAMLIRSVFAQGGAQMVTEMNGHVPDAPVGSKLDVAYGDEGITTMDVFSNAAPNEKLPTIVWVHGGAWISGSKADVAPYLQILAGKGYTAIGLNYGLGPEVQYPTAVEQINDALAYINENADELGVDPNQIVLAGDSAGAQLASQVATLIANESYAYFLGIKPSIESAQLSGLILNCGVYDMRAMAELQGLIAWGFQVSLWSYTGTKNWSASSTGAAMSTINFVTRDLPPTYISGGNGDGLTWLQSIPMAQALTEVGVEVTPVFWPLTHEPALPHEYQFHLDLPEAQEALVQTLEYLERVTD